MSNSNIITLAKREPTKKEAALSELTESIEELQTFLTSINRQGDLWRVFDALRAFVGACMKESEGEAWVKR